MSGIVKGEIVLATITDYGIRIRPDGRGRHDHEWVQEGDELEVTAAGNKEFLNVRRPGASRGVFRWRRENVRRVRQVGVAPDGAILPDDPRLAWLWEDASRLAERFGFCSEFDRLADTLGAPGREREFRIPMINEDGIRVVATVTARSRALAERRIRERITSSGPLELTGGRS